MDNLEKTDKFLEINTVLRLNQEEIENTKRPITSIEIETELEIPNKQKPRTRWLYRQILSNIWEELTPILLKLLKKITEERVFPNLFYEATVTLILKPDKDNNTF